MIGVGTHLGPYEIIAPAGAGGMGVVYRARDTRLNRDVAIKVLPEHFSHKPEARARFRREADSNSALMAVQVESKGGTLQFAPPQRLFTFGFEPYAHPTPFMPYAVSPDGQRFLIPQPFSQSSTNPAELPLTVVLNWDVAFPKR